MSTPGLTSSDVPTPDTGKMRIELQEWQTKDYWLTQVQALELLKIPGNLVEVQALPTGKIRLRAKASVGRLSTDSLDILIHPKCPVPSLLFMLAEVYELSTFTRYLVGYESSADIVDLLVQVFLRQVDYITRLGLKRDYVPRHDDLLAIRGCINIRRTLALHLKGQPRADCSYQEYTLDVPENQLLLTTLRVISSNKALPSVRRSLAHMLSGEFPGVSEIHIREHGLSHVVSDRLNSQYEPALKMAHLILRGMGIEHEFGCTDVSGFTLDMNQLFERFVSRRLQKILGREGVLVRFQQSLPFDEEKQAAVRPDLIFQSARGHRVVADTKYKIGDAPSPADLYQMLAYCTVLKIPCGILITAAGTGTRFYTVRDGATTIRVAPIDLDGSFQGIEEALQRLAHQIYGLLTGRPPAQG